MKTFQEWLDKNKKIKNTHMILQDFLDKNYTKQEQLELTELDCNSNQITSLEGIESLVNLKKLN
jgi:Leucine-rich repeat (LRR) protein